MDWKIRMSSYLLCKGIQLKIYAMWTAIHGKQSFFCLLNRSALCSISFTWRLMELPKQSRLNAWSKTLLFNLLNSFMNTRKLFGIFHKRNIIDKINQFKLRMSLFKLIIFHYVNQQYVSDIQWKLTFNFLLLTYSFFIIYLYFQV